MLGAGQKCDEEVRTFSQTMETMHLRFRLSTFPVYVCISTTSLLMYVHSLSFLHIGLFYVLLKDAGGRL